MGSPGEVAVVAAAAATIPPPARGGDIAPGLAFGVAAGTLTTGAVEVSPYHYDGDGYIYGPLPYGRSYIPDGSYRSRIYRAPGLRRGSRIHSIARVRHVTRAYHVFDPYYGSGPFYFHHYCCRYW